MLGLGKDPEFGADVSTAAGREVGWKCDEVGIRCMCRRLQGGRLAWKCDDVVLRGR